MSELILLYLFSMLNIPTSNYEILFYKKESMQQDEYEDKEEKIIENLLQSWKNRCVLKENVVYLPILPNEWNKEALLRLNFTTLISKFERCKHRRFLSKINIEIEFCFNY